MPSTESDEADTVINRILSAVGANINLDGILSIASDAGEVPDLNTSSAVQIKQNIKIGVIRDRVFSFYYPENLEALCRFGAEPVFIDSLTEHRLPDIQGLYIGGGFPELFLEELERNVALKDEIAEAIRNGLPVYAECAGLMYLCQGIVKAGRVYKMVGSIPAVINIFDKPQGHGYTIAEVVSSNPWFPLGTVLKGHEFHYSGLNRSDHLHFACKLKRGVGVNGDLDGIVYQNLFASYAHLHALGVPQWAESFCRLANAFKSKQVASII